MADAQLEVKKLLRCDICSRQCDGEKLEKVLGRMLCGDCYDAWLGSPERKRGMPLDVAHFGACYLEFRHRRSADVG